MSNKQLIAKDNKLIGASYSLGIPEQRLIFLAIIEAREQKQLIDAKGVLNIRAKSYQEQFKVEKHTSYDALKSATSGLFDAHFEYEDIHEKTGKQARHVIRWVQKISYIDDAGMVELQFTDAVIPLITRLSEQYTEYELKQVSELQSEYSIRLYELMMQWKAVGKTNKISVDDLRRKLGVEPKQYKKMNNFKARVLDHAINQINEHTDIQAEYDQYKDGRAIAGFTFKFKVKKNKVKIAAKVEADNVDRSTIEGLNDKQLGRIARNPSFIADYNDLVSSTSPAGQDMNMWELEMINRLKKDISQFKKRPIREYLEY
ncbi:replication initiation protein RepM [Psychrobacter cryohalolentis]|uniref:Initiator RepB protein n=1 Tax=Psychrobacter cryohalolentis (strain ATCC BAA-1226 / DSM 17306 / VKM B-2378 / K5) TaxID=335284 RepID=Q1Q7S1_PSYCK|nr:replication initiation protein RepM [Psychrobacter cryohalolentis]ABE76270.1 initiator RepB protein [Psychrobacter cryohalolentis K5]ASE25060.1 replication initiation protein [Psychrobacter cryohalolentis]